MVCILLPHTCTFLPPVPIWAREWYNQDLFIGCHETALHMPNNFWRKINSLISVFFFGWQRTSQMESSVKIFKMHLGCQLKLWCFMKTKWRFEWGRFLRTSENSWRPALEGSVFSDLYIVVRKNNQIMYISKHLLRVGT